MIAPSFERSSLVHERCTTCGSLLPCVLHDRLTRRAVLSREKEKPPGYEMTWETNEIDAEIVIWISDSRCLTITKGDRALCFLEKSPDSQTWQINHVDMSGFGDFEWTYGKQNKISTGTLLANGHVLLAYTNGMFIQFDPNELINGRYKMTKIRSGLAWNDTQTEITSLFELKDGSFLAVKSGSNIQLVRLYKRNDQWSEHRISVPVKNGSDDSYHDFSRILPLPDGTFVACEALSNFMFHLIPPVDGFVSTWTCIGVYAFFPDPVRNAYFNSIGGIRFVKSGSKLCFYEFNLTNSISRVIDIGTTMSKEACYLTHALSNEVFLVCVVGGDVELWTRQASDKWESEVIICDLKQRVTKVVSTPGDKSGFFLYFEGKKKTDDDRLCYYQIPPVKLRAYHERQARQKEIPPLPADV